MTINMKKNRNEWQKRAIAVVVASVVALMWMSQPPIEAQSVNSGSDESDGALSLAANLGVIVFDPTETARWGRVLDDDGDGVYNFTTISVAAGTTLRFRGDTVNRPIYFLASGNVSIVGTLDLSGAAGFITLDPVVRRQLAVPGAGGFAGGAGGVGTVVCPTAGDGPSGGAAASPCDGNNRSGVGGRFSGNRYLLPLVGGSGGGGGLSSQYVNGGAGGGAVLIASSTSIAIAGTVAVTGGNGALLFVAGACSGAGSGGAIRLIAPTISGNGHLNASAGTSPNCGSQTHGLVRLEAYSISSSLIFDAGGAFVTQGSPVDATTFRPSYQLRVTAIAGVAVPPNPSGSFVVPDLAISSATVASG